MVPPLLRETGFRRFWIGQTASLFGDEITLFAIPITAVLLLHADPAEMGLLTAAGLLPSLVLSVPAGAWVDGWGRRRLVMAVCDAARALLLLSVPLAWLTGTLTLAQLYVVALVVGVFDVFFSVAYQSLFAVLVPKEDYVDGQALLNGSRAAAFVGGNGLAGLLVTVFSAPGALIADALTFVTSAATLRSINPQEPPAAVREPGRFRVGLNYIRHSAVIGRELFGTTIVNLFTFMINAILILYVTRELHVHPGVLGLIVGAAGIGSLISAALTPRMARRIGMGRTFAVGMVLFPAPLILIPLAHGSHATVLLMLFLAEFGSGFGVMMLDIGAGALNATYVPTELRARVAGAFRMINYGIRPVGALLGGWLGTVIGLRPTLFISAVGAVLCFLPLIGSPILRADSEPELVAAR